MNNLLATTKRTVGRALPNLKTIGKGALIGGVPLYFIATVSFGLYSGAYGLPVASAEPEDLQASISEAFSFGK